jgi:hypothetical protein
MAIKAHTDGTRVGNATVVRVSPKALLVLLERDNSKRWIPVSQIHDDSEVHDRSKVGDVGDLVVTQWLGEKLGV